MTHADDPNDRSEARYKLRERFPTGAPESGVRPIAAPAARPVPPHVSARPSHEPGAPLHGVTAKEDQTQLYRLGRDRVLAARAQLARRRRERQLAAPPDDTTTVCKMVSESDNPAILTGGPSRADDALAVGKRPSAPDDATSVYKPAPELLQRASRAKKRR